MATVQTVLGPIDESALGLVLAHEHVRTSRGNDMRHYPWMYDWPATRARCIREAAEAKAGGVDTILEMTTPDLGRNVRFVYDVAAATGLNVVMSTGIWLDVPRSFWARDIDEIADIFVHEIEVGIEDTTIRAGVIKVANDEEGVTPEGERVLRGAARAAKRTNVPISSHHFAPTEVGRRQLEVMLSEGVPPHLVAIGHSADTTDLGYLEDMLRTGCYLVMDRYGLAPSHDMTWEQRNETVRALVERGWAHRMMLGHDNSPRPVLLGQLANQEIAGYPSSTAPATGPTRYLFVPHVAVPGLRASGVSQEAIDLMMREVPRRFLTGTAPAA